MELEKMRVLYKSGSTITDITTGVKRYETGNESLAALTASTDAIYIGQEHPFNHLFFRFNTANADASNMTVKIYDGTEFVDVAELIDETSLAGASFGQSGYVTWQPDRDEAGWQWDDTDDITELNTVKIYDLYWIEITFSANLTAGFDLKWLGNLFCNESELYAEYPFFNRSNIKSVFSATDWEPQCVRASELLIKEMQRKNLLTYQGQILRRNELILPSVPKVAEVIYAAMGDDYNDDMLKARNKSDERLHSGIFKLDKNRDGDLNQFEQKKQSGYLKR